jgi:hypothetical protein
MSVATTSGPMSPPSRLEWIMQLRPQRPGEIPPASGPEILARARARVGDGPVEWVVETGQAMAELIIREMPEFGGGGEAFDILRMGTESSTIQFLLNLVDSSDTQIATEEALDGVLDFVRRGIGLESVLRGTRLGHRAMSESFLWACETLGDASTRVDEMKLLTTRLFEYMDAFAAALAGQYLEDQVRWSTSDTAARLELVQAILGGTNPDPTAALKSLRYDLRGTHVAIVAWSNDAHTDVDSVELQAACARFLKELNAVRRIVMPVGAGLVWSWGEFSAAPPELERLVSHTRLLGGMQLVVGTPAAGIPGFRASHVEAEAVRRLIPLGRRAALTAYSQVDVLSLLLEDRSRAVTFAARELRSLATDSATHRDLRETVAVFLDENGSTQAAAQRLMVARNTVSYRIRRAEETMGRPVRERQAQLRAALMIASALPTQVDAAAQA